MKSIINTIVAFASLTTLTFAHCESCGTEKKKEIKAVEIGKPAPDFTLKTASSRGKKSS